jgi:hypothetical protein
VEVGPRGRRPTGARWPRRWTGADAFFGLSREGRADGGHGPLDGAQPDHLRHGQSRSRRSRPEEVPASATTRSWRRAARTIPTRSTTSSASPTSSAARSTCAPPRSTMEMKIAAAQALAELAREDVPDEVAAAYQGNAAALRPGIHHPGAVRSAPDPRRAGRRRQGGDG